MTIFYHLIDHQPPGSILYLVNPLSQLKNHIILTSFKNEYEEINKNLYNIKFTNDVCIIIHSTGRNGYFFQNAEKICPLCPNSFIFMHVSPYYLKIKKRHSVLHKLKTLENLYGTKVLTTGTELANLYKREKLVALPIQIGIDTPNNPKQTIKLRSTKKLIVTTCTSKSKIYQKIKGIDLFIQLIKKYSLESKAIIVGYSMQAEDGIKRLQLPHKKFQNLLSSALVYIQLSRTEAYNLTAIEAKRLGVPIIVSDLEGHIDNVKYGFRVKNLEEASRCLELILTNPENSKINDLVSNNRIDSYTRESLKSFGKSFEDVIK